MKRQVRTLVYGAVLLATLASLSACAPMIVGGAVMTGVMATDRRTTGTQVEDESIELKVASAVRKEMGERIHLNATSFNRQVLLTGEVRTAADKERAEKLASSQENVTAVVNDLAVMPISSLTQRSKDVVLTGRIKAAFVDAKDLQVNAFKVVTERGTVYLMGRVTPREAKRATDMSVARLASRGVTRPIRYTVPRSVTTLKALTCKSLASTKAALILPVRTTSLERWVSELMGITAKSLTTAVTFSWLEASFSARSLSAAVRTSPVSKTCRLKLVAFRWMRSPISLRTALATLSSMLSSSTWVPVVRRSVAITPVITAPPTIIGAQALRLANVASNTAP